MKKIKQINKNMGAWCCPACGKCHSLLKLSCDCPGFVRYEISGTSTGCLHVWVSACGSGSCGHTGPCQYKCGQCGMYRGF